MSSHLAQVVPCFVTSGWAWITVCANHPPVYVVLYNMGGEGGTLLAAPAQSSRVLERRYQSSSSRTNTDFVKAQVSCRTGFHFVLFSSCELAGIAQSVQQVATGETLRGPIPGGRRDFAHPPGAHLAFYTMGTGSLPRVKRPGRGIGHPPHRARRLKKE